MPGLASNLDHPDLCCGEQGHTCEGTMCTHKHVTPQGRLLVPALAQDPSWDRRTHLAQDNSGKPLLLLGSVVYRIPILLAVLLSLVLSSGLAGTLPGGSVALLTFRVHSCSPHLHCHTQTHSWPSLHLPSPHLTMCSLLAISSRPSQASDVSPGSCLKTPLAVGVSVSSTWEEGSVTT